MAPRKHPFLGVFATFDIFKGERGVFWGPPKCGILALSYPTPKWQGYPFGAYLGAIWGHIWAYLEALYGGLDARVPS